jgi:hypothetical protein
MEREQDWLDNQILWNSGGTERQKLQIVRLARRPNGSVDIARLVRLAAALYLKLNKC